MKRLVFRVKSSRTEGAEEFATSLAPSVRPITPDVVQTFHVWLRSLRRFTANTLNPGGRKSMIQHYHHLFEYDDWANRRTIAALGNATSARSLQILAHLLITKQEYFERLDGKNSTGFDFWPDLTIEGCRELARSTHENYVRILAGADESLLERKASYKTSEGVPYENTYRDLLTHVLLHSSIHRGNIVLKMREEGLEPPKIDYILYLRQ